MKFSKSSVSIFVEQSSSKTEHLEVSHVSEIRRELDRDRLRQQIIEHVTHFWPARLQMRFGTCLTFTSDVENLDCQRKELHSLHKVIHEDLILIQLQHYIAYCLLCKFNWRTKEKWKRCSCFHCKTTVGRKSRIHHYEKKLFWYLFYSLFFIPLGLYSHLHLCHLQNLCSALALWAYYTNCESYSNT